MKFVAIIHIILSNFSRFIDIQIFKLNLYCLLKYISFDKMLNFQHRYVVKEFS